MALGNIGSHWHDAAMKYVVCVPDGCADEPLADLGGRTPLEVAAMPVLSRLAGRGEVGRAAVIPPGMPPGSDVGNMSILGYDPARFHTGRAPIEAAAMGLRLPPDRLAYRCNLVTVASDGVMVDFAGGHPTSEDARRAIEAIDGELGGEISFHPGVSYRHVMVAPAEWADADCAAPHDLTDKPVVLPTGPAADKLTEVMEASRSVLARFPELAANQVWLWGQGFQPQMPSFYDTHGVEGGLCTAVDLVRGLGVLTGMSVVEVEGATGGYDTNYEGKREAALAALADGVDLFLIHVEASDEAGHAGDLDEKIAALENWDRRILAELVAGLDEMGPWRMLLLPDHPTPIRLRTHTTDSVPYLLYDSTAAGPGGVYTETATGGAEPVMGFRLMGRLVGG
ncbi:MAG: cofactor-independent phosphoglycerate mutase [Actinobacteria bacterium]|nr:MAG: cofactor-independent phosphoglycerate mutase [Actinomycetota bacterium]RIK05003.1 MAG: cofactor-independent phosphoglycerate mutase [Acidobacteriota bacterium]